MTDPREVAHIECDCVPDLGPSHCHLCSERRGAPVPWTTAHPAPSVKPSVEDVARRHSRVSMDGTCICGAVGIGFTLGYGEHLVAETLALLPGRTEAESGWEYALAWADPEDGIALCDSSRYGSPPIRRAELDEGAVVVRRRKAGEWEEVPRG